jgi:phage shock protein A
MGILDRLSTLIKSNLNSAIDKVSDPGKEIDQVILEMEEQQKQARAQVQAALVLEKREQQRADALKTKGAEWGQRAERALAAGDEGLAKEALQRKLEAESEQAEIEAALETSKKQSHDLTLALRELDQRVKEAKARKETLKIQARNKKREESGEETAADRYDKLVTSVDVKEAEVQLTDELADEQHKGSKAAEVDRRFADMEKGSAVDDRLAALKAKLAPAPAKAELPPAASEEKKDEPK